MRINGYPLVEWALMNMRNGGITDICVVLGKEAGRISPYLIPYQVKIIECKDYEKKNIEDQIRLGLDSLMSPETESICIMSCNTPLVSPGTIKILQEAIWEDLKEIAIPLYKMDQGYPFCISLQMGEKMMTEPLNEGLQEFFFRNQKEIKRVQTKDPGVLMNADSIEDFTRLTQFGKERYGLAESLATVYWEEQKMSHELRMKALQCRTEAVNKGILLNEKGAALDLTLIDSGALLWDLFPRDQYSPKDERVYWEKEGYQTLAKVIGYEQEMDDLAEWSEGRVVFETYEKHLA